MGRQNKFKGQRRPERSGFDEEERRLVYSEESYDQRMHHRREDFPRFRDGRIGRQKKKGQKYNFDRQLQEDLSYAKEERQEPRRDYRRGGPRHIPSGVELWNRITIKNVKATKDELLKSIIEACPVPFVPVYYHLRGEFGFFFVESSEAASAIQRLHITLPVQGKIEFGETRRMPIQNIPVDERVQIKLRQVLERRYDPLTQSLDLSNFHYDESLCHEYYIPLSRPMNMKEVMRIITENTKDLKNLDLSDNKLQNLDNVEILVDKSVEVKALNVSNNRIQSLNVFAKLKGLPLESLILDGNPIATRLKEKGNDTYRREIRRFFPKVVVLDSDVLPAPVTFDVEPDGFKVPDTQPKFLVNEGVNDVLHTFVNQYYSFYDQGRRSELSEAYHEDVLFSLTAGPLPKNEENQFKLGAYFMESRNLMRIKESSVRSKKVRRGRSETIKLLETLPKSVHDPESFRYDVTIVTDTLMSINLKGVFREETDSKSVIRSFTRFFVICPTPRGGYYIINDLLFISNASKAQEKVAFKPVETPLKIEPSTSSGLETVQREMIAQFSVQSGMNVTYAQQCLESRNWDYNAAAELFQQMVAANAVPPEAFQR
ncbi:nuclear RNA export factor 1-like [Artemia franciscana]|uniref:nuclear RNA export factor 1-like n=1 Tax=Artemia franciscana TaxID=6661 RepID=UPI0032D9E526